MPLVLPDLMPRAQWSERCRRLGGRTRRLGVGLALSVGVGGLAACSPADLVSGAQLPSNVTDPAALQTPAGALQAYYGALVLFSNAFGSSNKFIRQSGLLTDELQADNIGLPLGSTDYDPFDTRLLPEGIKLLGEGASGTVYGDLQRVRGQVAQARGLLRQYWGDSARALVGQLYAIEGYSELLLAELYCSGIPLSTLDYQGDYTLEPGSTTTAVLQHALTRFDSALALATDSARVLNLARVGQGRALLDLGQYPAAAQAVAQVPDEFRFRMVVSDSNISNNSFLTVADREGGNGLDYRTSGDPRTASTDVGTNPFGMPMYQPEKYSEEWLNIRVLADGIEARLIQAEAALQAGDTMTWRATLNHLRQTAWPTIQPAVAGPLDTLSDPGSDTARVSLTFRERAFWLFLTGHRQGDLRRLIRYYGRSPEAVYPTRSYPGGPGQYGPDVTVPIPVQERQLNPKFTGCFNRGA